MVTAESVGDDRYAAAGAADDDEDMKAIAAVLRQLVAEGLGPAIGFSGDWRKRSAVERVARLGPEELGRRLAAIHDTHRAALVGLATKILGNRDDAEDAVSEAFIRVLSANPDLQAVDALPGYLRTAVQRQAYDRGRAVSRDRAARDTHDPVDLDARLTSDAKPLEDRVCDQITLAVAFHLLPPRQRQCFVVRYVEERSVAETADRLDTSEGNVKGICSEVRSRIATALEPV